MYEILDHFKGLLFDFVVTCMVDLVDICVLVYWKLDECLFGNYTL